MPEPKTKVIAGHEFTISQPYEAGHPLTEIEAKVLNQVRSENIGNNVRKQVTELLAAGAVTEAEAIVSERDASYEFSTPSAGGGRRTLDPVEKEARSIARTAITEKLKAAGRKVSDVSKEQMENAIAAAIEKNDWIMTEAKKRAKAKEKFAEQELDGLDIGV